MNVRDGVQTVARCWRLTAAAAGKGILVLVGISYVGMSGSQGGPKADGLDISTPAGLTMLAVGGDERPINYQC